MLSRTIQLKKISSIRGICGKICEETASVAAKWQYTRRFRLFEPIRSRYRKTNSYSGLEATVEPASALRSWHPRQAGEAALFHKAT
jgi:hypothetical protein